MTPLKVFSQIVQALAIKPLAFWPVAEQQHLLNQAQKAIGQLKQTLEVNELQDSNAYSLILNLEQAVGVRELQEVTFIQNLDNLLEIYQLAPTKLELEEQISQLEIIVHQTKKKILEYHLALEALSQQGRKLTTEQKTQSDRETIEKIGFFYILEYTLYVLWQLPQLAEPEQKNIFYQGLKTKEANLPPYTFFADSFRREFCYKIYNEKLRRKLLEHFFAFEVIFRTGDLKRIRPAFKQFNLALLKSLAQQGIKTFRAAILTPFGSEVPIDQLISQVEQFFK